MQKTGSLLDFLLIAACILGAFLATLSLFRQQSIFPDNFTNNNTSNEPAIARVNGIEISETLYRRVIDGMQNQKKSPLLEQDLLHVRDKLIEEELLVQRGEELGFLQLHAGVRREMLQAVMETAVAEKRSEPVDEQALKDFFENHRETFSQPGQLRVRRLQFDQEPKAQAALAALAQQQSFETIEKNFAQKTLLPIPDTLLAPTQLRQYLSAESIKQLTSLELNQYSNVIYENQRWFIYQVLEKTQQEAPSFEAVKAQVEQAYLRERDEQSLQLYLDWLKKRADISMKDPQQLKAYLTGNPTLE